ncbi:PREDICTED: cytoplasmic polyadenylation element-binding protein 1-like [Branchiostoma belcheri]|uniref:Cytoplasmic polyadenylation element-binding protein 1-like n=1 Tax=Branchiostoma belcheri TaxID=7741 RepID=A0A6P4Z918_BRABE|nr:PREDICTED: cytoplasmic polyadenylation element-binding protein 1-like [Branchiostoma belcheri]
MPSSLRMHFISKAWIFRSVTASGEGFSHLYDRRIERDARMYRNAAAMCEPTCTWSGQLPMRQHKCPIYSPKVFLGGVPWDITEVGLQAAFKPFGPINVEWPGKDNKHPRYPPKGYVYVLFESDKAVKSLLQACTHEFSHGGEFFYKISSRRLRCKKVEIIPWVTSDSNYVRCPSQRLDPGKTVFVGALHGRLNAERLANIMNDLFGGVVYAGIDTDKHKYPIGSGRVTFGNHKSYMKAVQAAFIEIKTPKFTKKVQVDPYLEDSLCNTCNSQPGPFFCREMSCFRYYCPSCWQWHHSLDTLRHHQPLLRNKKSCSGISLATNHFWTAPDQDFTRSRDTLAAAWPSLRHGDYYWKVLSADSIECWSYHRHGNEINYHSFRCDEPETLRCGQTKAPV